MEGGVFMKTWSLLCAMLFCLLSFSSPALAQEEEKWEFVFVPYGWFAGLNGDLTVRDEQVDVNIPFSDVWDALDFGALGHLEARKSKWGGFLDVIYLKLSTDQDITTEPASLAVDLGYKQWTTELGGFDRFWSDPSGVASWDVLVGGRYWKIKSKLDLQFSLPEGQIAAVSREEDSDWIDPFVGLRFQARLVPRLLLDVRGDVGGLGIGSASHSTWNLVALLGYELSDTIGIWAGYKSLWLDQDEAIDADLTMHGPVAGVSFVF
jgi:hypothetical protein